jgi:hypothetical protein
VSFPTGAIVVVSVGTGVMAANSCNAAAYVSLQGGGQALVKLHKAGYAVYGKSWKKEVDIPYNATDYSPQVAQATQGTDCIDAGLLPESVLQQWMPAFTQSGAKQRMIGLQGNLDNKVCEKFQAACNNALAVGMYPPLSEPVWSTMRASLDKYDAPKDLEYNSLGALNTWAAYTIFKNIVKGMQGAVDAKTFMATADKTSHVDSEGMTPPLDFTKEWTVPGMNRVFSRSILVDQYKDGSFKPYITKWVDLSPVFAGKPAQGIPAS